MKDTQHHITWEVKRSGQVAAYKDTITQYELKSNQSEGFIKLFCTQILRFSRNESPNGCYTGSCSFPFGMESYYSFVEIEANVYIYTVCNPYTG